MNNLIWWKNLFASNKKVLENYFFMTVLQVLNSFFYLLIYPYLIRTLGLESYGLYVFAYSIIWYFITLTTFGFDMPAVKAIAKNTKDSALKSKVLSCVFTAKIYMEIVAVIVFAAVIFSIPGLQNNWLIYCILFFMTFTNIIFPQWYFQGMQKMRTVTLIQLIFKILSLPFIFLFVKDAGDLWIFAVNVAVSSLLGGVTALLIVRYREKLTISWQPISELKAWYKDALPFFLSYGGGMLKEQSVVQIVGIFLSMRDVAIYDLANKIILLPRALFSNVNGAIFPKLIANLQEKIVKKVIYLEALIGLGVVMIVILFGKFVVVFLGGESMLASYPATIILSITVMMYLVVGAIHYFVFIPQNKYYYITQNQAVAIATFVLAAVVGLMFVKNVYILAAAITFSSVSELIYCCILTQKLNKKQKCC